MPRLVKAPLRQYPHSCMVTGRVDGEFIDFEAVPDVVASPHIYIQRGVVEHAAKTQLGMVLGTEVQKLSERVTALTAELEQLKETAAALETLEAAIKPKEEIPSAS